MPSLHGGDIYRNLVKSDFSVNTGPFGVPPAVNRALHDAVSLSGVYPDPQAAALGRTVSDLLSVPEDMLLFGNGASELFMAITHGLKPGKTLIPVPSFYGYEHAAKAVDGEIIYYEMKQEDNFCLTEDFHAALTQDIDLLFLANPNNPTGRLMGKEELMRILEHCRDMGIYVALDECFIEFSGWEASMVSESMRFNHMILVRAFTKIFSIPGVRLGYLVCSDRMLLHKIKSQLPEWNLSVFAQEAGRVCAGQTEFVMKTAEYVREEREYLAGKLKEKGYTVFPGDADFILIYREETPEDKLYDRLLEKGILIRDCSNFRGLGEGYYRIAVRSRRENELLLGEL